MSVSSASSRNPRVALVLGGGGGIGSEAVLALARRGWTVRALHRRARTPSLPAAAGLSGHVEWVRGDAMDRASVVAAAQGVAVIVHAVNPPGYQRWREVVVPMIDNTIAAATAVGARIVLPGTVYNFGPDAFPLLREDSPQRPTTVKGGIRVELEERLRTASRGGARVLIVRCGDFFGPRSTGNDWFSQLVKPGAPVRSITYPGRRGVGHQWAYLPDVAETMARLLERDDELPDFARFHFGGNYDPDGTAMIAAIRRVVGDPSLRVRAFPWWAVTLCSPFVSLFRELREMRYLWRVPVRLDGAALERALGDELPRTPLDEAVRVTLRGMGCAEGARAPAIAAAAAARG